MNDYRELTRSIVQIVSDKTKIPVADIMGARRFRPIVRARQIAAWAIYRTTDLGYPNTAWAVGRVDHTTALYSVRMVDYLRDRDPVLRDLTNDIYNTVMTQGDASYVCA